jgi:hypothetical protein
MGLGKDFLILMGCLPIEIPNEPVYQHRKNYFYLNKMPKIDNDSRNFLNLFYAMGKNVSVRDKRKGVFEGTLNYEIFSNNYSIKNSEGIIRLKVRDLEKITNKESLN